jgi:hypothetical protein
MPELCLASAMASAVATVSALNSGKHHEARLRSNSSRLCLAENFLGREKPWVASPCTELEPIAGKLRSRMGLEKALGLRVFMSAPCLHFFKKIGLDDTVSAECEEYEESERERKNSNLLANPRWALIFSFGTARILSPVCLPIPPSGRK